MSVIYGLYDPRRPQTVRYVGKAAHAKKRLFEHVANAFERNPVNARLAAWLRKLVEKGVVPAARVLERVDIAASWQERECYWIDQYSGPHLFNIRVGGGGGAFISQQDSTRLAIHAREIAEKNIGRVWVNNGTRNLWVHVDEIPEGFERGRLHKSALPEHNRSSIWITDGKNNRQLRPGERMPETFRPGRVIWRGYNPKLAHKHGSGWRDSTWITNGTETRRVKNKDEPIPEGWHRGRHNMQWITNGKETKRCTPGQPIPEGWYRGRKLRVGARVGLLPNPNPSTGEGVLPQERPYGEQQ